MSDKQAPLTLGDMVKDRITGFSGIATGRSEYLYSSPRVEVQAEPLDDGKPREPVWFDEARLLHATGERVVGFVKPDPKR